LLPGLAERMRLPRRQVGTARSFPGPACRAAPAGRQGHGHHCRRHADALPARPIPGPRSGTAAGPGERGRDGAVRPLAASRDGDSRAHGPADEGDIVALRAAAFLDKDGTLLVDVPYNVDPARMSLAPGAPAGLRRIPRLSLEHAHVRSPTAVRTGRP